MNAGGQNIATRRELTQEEKDKAYEAKVSIDKAIQLKQKAGPDGVFDRIH